MAQSHMPSGAKNDTLEDLEFALKQALVESESDEVRYQIRTALQKVEVLRVHRSPDES